MTKSNSNIINLLHIICTPPTPDLYNVDEELLRFDTEDVLALLQRLLVPGGQQELVTENYAVPPLLLAPPRLALPASACTLCGGGAGFPS